MGGGRWLWTVIGVVGLALLGVIINKLSKKQVGTRCSHETKG
jgi:hypothetical protein